MIVFDAGPAGWLDLTNFVDYAISHRGPFNYYYDDHFGKHIQVFLLFIYFLLFIFFFFWNLVFFFFFLVWL